MTRALTADIAWLRKVRPRRSNAGGAGALPLCRLTAHKSMDQRIEAFLADVLALHGESPEAIRERVRTALRDCETTFRAQEANKRMKDKAAHACHSLCRNRVAEEMRVRKGTTAGEHLQFVLSVIDGPRSP